MSHSCRIESSLEGVTAIATMMSTTLAAVVSACAIALQRAIARDIGGRLALPTVIASAVFYARTISTRAHKLRCGHIACS